MKLPCENCITLAICKNPPELGLDYVNRLIHKCSLLKKYVEIPKGYAPGYNWDKDKVLYIADFLVISKQPEVKRNEHPM